MRAILDSIEFRKSPTLYGVLACALLMLLGPLYTAPGYSVIAHTSSDLGAQNTPMNWLMNLGFIALGAGVFLDARRLWWRAPFVAAVFIVFGLTMALTGVFSARPTSTSLPYSDMADLMHSVMAGFVGVSFTLGAVSFMFLESGSPRKRLCLGAALWATACSLAMVYLPDYQGLLQRLMFLITFPWLAAFLPQAKDSGPRTSFPHALGHWRLHSCRPDDMPKKRCIGDVA